MVRGSFDFARPMDMGAEGQGRGARTWCNKNKSRGGDSEKSSSHSEVQDSDLGSPCCDTVGSTQGGSSVSGVAHMPLSPAKSKEEWLADVKGISSKAERAIELADILAHKSKKLSEAQMALNLALSVLDERNTELIGRCKISQILIVILYLV